MFLLLLLGCRTSIQFDFLAILVIFLFLNCCPSFGCARRRNVSFYTSILAGSQEKGLGFSLEIFCRVEEIHRLLFQNWKLKFYWDVLYSG